MGNPGFPALLRSRTLTSGFRTDCLWFLPILQSMCQGTFLRVLTVWLTAQGEMRRQTTMFTVRRPCSRLWAESPSDQADRGSCRALNKECAFEERPKDAQQM